MKEKIISNQTSLKWQDGKIISKGFGQIATSLMEDGTISLGAKGLYVYFACKTGAAEFCYPSNTSIMKALGIKSKNTLSDYKNELIGKGLLKVAERTYKSGQLTSNKYYPAKMIRYSE